MARSIVSYLNQWATYALVAAFLAYVTYTGHNLYSFVYPPACNHANCRGPATSPGLRYHVRIYKGVKLTGDPLWETRFQVSDVISDTVAVTIPQRVRDGKPMLATVVLTREGLSHEIKDVLYDDNTRKLRIELTRWAIPIRHNHTRNLLDGLTGAVTTAPDDIGGASGPSSEDAGDSSLELPPEMHLRPRVTINMVDTDARFTIYTQDATAMPIELLRHPSYKMTEHGYLPWFGIDDLGLTRRELHRINSSHATLPVTFEYRPASIGKFRLWLNLEQSIKSLSTDYGFGEKDIDQMRKMYTETNPYLLIVTVVVSLFHILFDILAFKNDIGFWHNNKSMGGLSLRMVVGQGICHWIILLNLIETDQASPLILFGVGGTALIDTWKIYRAMKLRNVISTNKTVALAEARTREYDEYAMKRLSYLLLPGVVVAAVYSFVYEEHTRLYSWLIGSLANGVYVFGFILMTPQLFINYKLKSVARMPWRAFIYRAFNTFVDDLFSFIISMPLAHRLACFRDDIVFFIFLYQRWIYPVDESRKIQFFEDDEDEDDEKVDAKAKANRHIDTKTEVVTTRSQSKGTGKHAKKEE